MSRLLGERGPNMPHNSMTQWHKMRGNGPRGLSDSRLERSTPPVRGCLLLLLDGRRPLPDELDVPLHPQRGGHEAHEGLHGEGLALGDLLLLRRLQPRGAALLGGLGAVGDDVGLRGLGGLGLGALLVLGHLEVQGLELHGRIDNRLRCSLR